MSEHTISELSALTGLSVRTIRYYLAQGLIPAAGMEGPGTRYPEATLARLRLVARLRDAHLPLAEIRKQLLALSDDEVLALAGTPAEPEPAGTALDYVRSVLGGSRPERNAAPVAPVPPTITSPLAPSAPLAAARLPVMPRPASLLRRMVSAPQRHESPAPDAEPSAAPPLHAAEASAAPPLDAADEAPAAAPFAAPGQFAAPTQSAAPAPLAAPASAPAGIAPAAPASTPKQTPSPAPAEVTTPFGQRSQWERVALTPDIELHLRRPLSRRDNRLVDRLIAFARQLQEEQP
jgi:DNA-binding transcriptional MerR regulator